MPKIFLSWYDGQQHSLAAELFALLKTGKFEIEHSPNSPHSGHLDERWANWYDDGLSKALRRADIFLAVITPSCDGSTWMLQEYQEAYTRFLQTARPALYFVRFDRTEQPVTYPGNYLENSIQLPSNPGAAFQALANYVRRTPVA